MVSFLGAEARNIRRNEDCASPPDVNNPPTARDVAQPGRALGLGPRRRRFKSCRPDHLLINKKVFDLAAKTDELIAEKQKVVGQLRSGEFCSKCKRTKTEIEKGGESYGQHLGRVKGNSVPPSDEEIAKVAAKYDAEINGLIRQTTETRQLLTAAKQEAAQTERVRPEQDRFIQQRIEAIEQERRQIAQARAAADQATAPPPLARPLLGDSLASLGGFSASTTVKTAEQFAGLKFGGDAGSAIHKAFSLEAEGLLGQLRSGEELNPIQAARDAISGQFTGSDYPLINTALCSPHFYPLQLTGEQRSRISAIANPWDRDVELKQALGVPQEVFARSRQMFP